VPETLTTTLLALSGNDGGLLSAHPVNTARASAKTSFLFLASFF
jgi:hypothetical protein